MASKQTPTLKNLLADEREGSIKLAIGVDVQIDDPDPGLTRVERATVRRERFDLSVRPTVEWIEEIGGKVDTLAWSSSTVYATLPRASVDDLEAIEQVQELDAVGEMTTWGD